MSSGCNKMYFNKKKQFNVEPSCSISRPTPIKIYITCPYKRNLSFENNIITGPDSLTI